RKLLSLLAVTLGSAAATGVATLRIDVGDKVNRELRSFGANIAVTPAADSLTVSIGGTDYRPAGTGAYLDEADLIKLRRIFWRNNIMAFAPLLGIPAEVRGRRVELVGSWFSKELQVSKSETFRTGLRELHPAWKVDGRWPSDAESPGAPECLVGHRLADALGLVPGQTLSVKGMKENGKSETENGDSKFENRNSKFDVGPEPRVSNFEFRISGLLETGGPEDDQIFAPLAWVQQRANLAGQIRRVEVSALTKPEDAFAHADVTKLSPEEFDRWYCTPYVSSVAYQIQQALPGSEARPIHPVADTEGKILNRVGMLMAILAVAALVTAALAVASMMLATVLERQTEIGVLKSLGSTDAHVAAIFLLESGLVGLVGGIIGYFLGSLLASRLALQVFGTPADMHWIFFPGALALAILVTLTGSAWPLSRGLRISPAIALRD
ncbi:MAG: ABC transporter permease, partial [Deltaproteobacteria bacterium]